MRKEKEGQETTPDWLLLRRYIKDNSQEAFAALSARYLNLVYTVCLREVHDPELAQDVTQAVFLLLARTAPSFRSKTALPGWLFRTARFASQNARTREQRRRRYEEKAAMERHPQANTDEADWDEIEPLLNPSLARLRAADRDCLLLRFFQDMSFADVGASLGVSEDAARKRVVRALEKLKHFFGKEEVNLPSAALAGLLTAHAAQTAPTACQVSIAQLTATVLAGHASAALAGSSAYQLTEGVLKAMKIAKLKLLTSSIAVVVVGGAVSYGMLHGQDTASRTVILTGKARYEDGKPASGVHIGAQAQNIAEAGALKPQPFDLLSKRIRDLSWNDTKTRSDGSYRLAVGADIPYNVLLLQNNLSREGEDNSYVAVAAEGVSGHSRQTITVPDLILTPGAFVTGNVIDKATAQAVKGVTIGSYGPERPDSSSAIVIALTNAAGYYRLRVAPGKSLVYVADARYNGFTDTQAKARGLAKTITVTAGQSATADFQVTPK